MRWCDGRRRWKSDLDSSSVTNEPADDIEAPADSDTILELKQVIPDNFYVANGKMVIDIALSFAGLVVLAPIYGAVRLAIIIDDLGPVLFTQKRVRKDKHFFKLHKFRSMNIGTTRSWKDIRRVRVWF